MLSRIFKRRNRDGQPHGLGLGKPGSLPALPNTPAVAQPDAVRQFAELVGDPAVHASRAFVANILLIVTVLMLGLALWQILPLKTAVPYIVETTEHGVVGRVVEARQYRPEQRLIKSEIGRWVERLMLIDPHRTRDMLRQATSLVRGKAVAQLKDLIDQDQAFRRMLETPGLVRTVDATTVDVSKEGIAFVFVTTTERVSSGPAKVQRWRMTLHYGLVPPGTEAEIMANPLGLAITHIERMQEAS